MMRRKPQDKAANDDDDSTPNKLRRSPLSSAGSRSRYEIDHGSCDWKSSSSPIAAPSYTAVGGNGSRSSCSSNSNNGGGYSIDIPVIPSISSAQHSPTTEGLHHRKKQLYPSQTAVHDLRHPLAPSHRSRGRSYSHVNSNALRKAVMWKRAVQCFFASVLFGYLIFLYLAQNRYHWGKEPRPDHVVDNGFRRPSQAKSGKHGPSQAMRAKGGKNGLYLDSGRVAAKLANVRSGDEGFDDGDSSKRVHQTAQFLTLTIKNDKLDRPTSSLNAIHDYSFKSAGRQQSKQAYKEPSTPAFQRALEWSQLPLQNAKTARADRLKQRRKRTKPPAKQKSNAAPLWYKLDYSSEGTITSMQQRWQDDATSSETESDISSLCGTHAQEAAKHHPQNYHQQNQQPLGPQSRVLISGILSPLGLHLAIALHRQCKVTNFMGLDAQMPNDPLSRLEQQERLAVLIQELENVKSLQVPFLGLEVKRDKKSMKQRREEGVREKRLVELRNGTATSDDNDGSAQSTSYAQPHQKYGIPLSPGTNSDGSGPLYLLLDYRPTHIVHLAGTQSDSLLNSNYHAQNNNDDNPSHDSVFQNKGEEEEDISKESISSRPHLYDLRMGVTGMEQLLSGVVAQTMLSPRYGRENENGKIETPNGLSKADSVKMKRPHVVYASSYDALHFRDAVDERNQKARNDISTSNNNNEEEEHDNFHLGTPAPKRPPHGLHGVSRLIDEILSASYHALHGVSSIGLRFDAIYGPRGFGVPSTSVPIFHESRKRRRGVSPDVDLAEVAVRGLYRRWTDANKEKHEGDEDSGGKKEEERQLNLIEEAGWMHLAHDRRDYVFVEDAVGAIIAAMQYTAVQNSPTAFNIGSGEMSPLSSLSDEIQDLAYTSNDDHKETTLTKSKNVIDVERSSAARAASLSSNDYLRWSATTSLKDGAAKLLAWHLDRALPYFPPINSASEEGEVDYSSSPLTSSQPATDQQQPPIISIPLDGEAILNRRGISSCSTAGDDPTCLREAHSSYPCASECSTQSCMPSVFDSVLSIAHEATEGCEVLLYTMTLGYDVEEMTLETDFSDGEGQEEWHETPVCTIAFVPSESILVKAVIEMVPPNSLTERGISSKSDYETKVKLLNGYLSHHGWLLILVDGATQPLTSEDMFLSKLSPARLFHSSVRKAMYVDESFSHTPYPDDAQFLASETSRGVLKMRTVTGPDAKGHKTKYKLPEEPQRRAVLVVSPMRHIPNEDGHKMPLKEITSSLIKELGIEFEEDGREPKEIRAQREYYERARSLINSVDLRSPNSFLRHKLEVKDFIRTKWIIHHLKLEEGHQLRCEWYKEHVRWNTHLDQLSFAYVMAKRELARKMITKQPLPLQTQELTILQKIIQKMTDASEWHPIISAEGTALPIHHSQIAPEAIPLNLQDLPDNEISRVNPDAAYSDVGSTYYVRIMSDARMLESRVKWMKARNMHRKRVRGMKEAAANEAAAALANKE